MDLTKSILEAKSYLKDVQMEQLIFKIVKLSDELNCFVDWDEEDGEQWGRLMLNKRMVVLYHVKIPLIFVDDNFHKKAIKYLEDGKLGKIVVLNVDSWDRTDYSADFSVISNIVDWHSSSISKKMFSINELWFATV
ncbi:MAG: hypothetical protein OIF50_09825 [Flavobacteriaceae bacterium]|nr:hypothetical protein [Flavobacteriaceae bacterium]